jgi:4-hydroxy-4-methyl-2-oxoglutarate aldolase
VRQDILEQVLEQIEELDTCMIANAIEQLGVRMRNEGFTRPGLHAVTVPGARILGYAATCRIRSADPPLTGHAYIDRTDWWDAIERVPAPRIAVYQDLDPSPGVGAAAGEVHAAILRALGCAGLITNGAVRDVPAVSRMKFPMFAPLPGVSHSYMHLVDYGEPVEILGLKIHSGDLLCADCHGVVSIPHDIAEAVVTAAARIRETERRIIAFCQSPDFSAGKLREIVAVTDELERR